MKFSKKFIFIALIIGAVIGGMVIINQSGRYCSHMGNLMVLRDDPFCKLILGTF